MARRRGRRAAGAGESPDRILFLKPEEIDHIEACGNYVVLHAGKEKHIVRETMTATEPEPHQGTATDGGW